MGLNRFKKDESRKPNSREQVFAFQLTVYSFICVVLSVDLTIVIFKIFKYSNNFF